MPFQQHEQTGLVWFTADVLNDVPHGFSTRKGGVSPAPWDSLNLRPGQGDGPEKLRENYRRFFAVLGLDETRAVLSQQTHTANIRTVTAEDAGKGSAPSPGLHRCGCSHHQRPRSAPDGLFRRLRHRAAVRPRPSGHRRRSRRLAGLRRRDRGENRGSHGCGLWEPSRRAAGGAGPLHRPLLLRDRRRCAGGHASRIGSECRRLYHGQRSQISCGSGRLNRQWLLRASLLPERIEVSGICTACRPDLFWSHRKMGDQRGVQVAVISLKEGL